MMKKRLLLWGLLLIIGIAGCSVIQPNLPPFEPDIVLLSPEGAIYKPLVDGMPFSYEVVQPGEKIELDFNPGYDQYDDKTGLSSLRYTLIEVRIKCDEKDVEDTVFWPSDRFTVPYIDNDCWWFPGWTGPIEPIAGLPFLFEPLPEAGYPFASCGSHVIDAMPPQQVTIAVLAKANEIEVGLVLEELMAGAYQIEWPGILLVEETVNAMPSHWLDGPGTIAVTCPDGEILPFVVPIDWFLIDNEFVINMGPSGECYWR